MSLEKIAARQPLSKEDIIAAANEYVELEKQAAAADAFGRDLAHKYVGVLEKQASEEKKPEVEKVAADKELQSALELLRNLKVIA